MVESPAGWSRWLTDESWAARGGSRPLLLGLATFGILALELALIRWLGGQVRIFAYFNNLVLIAAFLGMGLGLALGRRWPGLVHLALPLLALLALVLSQSEALGLMDLRFPDPSIHLWGAEARDGEMGAFALNLLLFMALFSAVAAVFVCAGAAVGHLFEGQPVLRAYGADLAGSLLGILAMTAATFLGAGPPAWLALGVSPFLWLSPRPVTWISGALVVLLGWSSVGDAIFSPYNRIDVTHHDTGILVSVNRDFHQLMHDLSDEHLRRTAGTPQGADLQHIRQVYDLPFSLVRHRGRALIVGAGTGNDVQGARRAGFQEIVSVDIDPRLIALGQQSHPEAPYSDPRVRPVVNDARAFFQQYQGEPFDLVCYGLLDSHAMFGALSTLRLDNYVYTREGLRAAWRHVKPDGAMAVSFSLFGGPWIGERLYWTLTEATGIEPLMIQHGMHFGATFVVTRDPANLVLEGMTFPTARPATPHEGVRVATDDWPFLYLRPGMVPWGYLAVLICVLLLTAVSVRACFGREALGSHFDGVLFLMGAGFLLLEARGITVLSLTFGSTWMVNSAIFASVLLLVLAGNTLVARLDLQRPEPWFAALLLATALLGFFNVDAVSAYPLAVRGLVGGLVLALPIGFAGVIVPLLLRRSPAPASALGSNLVGSVLGGCLEYLSMAVGLQALALLALALYAGAVALHFRRRGS